MLLKPISSGDLRLNGTFYVESGSIVYELGSHKREENGVSIGTRRISVRMLSGSEELDTFQVQANASYIIRCRYLSGVKAEGWIICDGKRYDIVAAIDVEERHIELVVFCNRRVE